MALLLVLPLQVTRPPEGPLRGPLIGLAAPQRLPGVPPALQVAAADMGFGTPDGPRLGLYALPADNALAVFAAGPPDSPAYYVVGFAPVVHHLGTDGALIPSPDFIVPLLSDAAGTVSYRWPAPFPPAVESWHQVAFQDPGAPDGWSESNVLWIATP